MSELLQKIQPHIDPVRRRYDSLSDSERLLVKAVAVIIVAVLVFLLLMLPAQRSVDDAKMKLSGKQNLLQWMQDNEPLVRQAAAQGNAPARSDQPLQTIITSTAPPMGVNVKRFEPESNGKLRIWLDQVPFDKTVLWLHRLQTRYGIQIVNVSVDAEREQGLVSAKLVLQK